VLVEEGGDPATLVKKVTKQRRSSARIEVKWDKLGSGSDRARWDSNDYTLTVNMDAPELVGMEPESNLFQEKARQIAIAAFSIALVETKSINDTPEFDRNNFIDVLNAVRNAQNDLGKAFHAAKVKLETVTSEKISEVSEAVE